MPPTAEKFFSLLRYSIGEQQEPPDIRDEEWEPINVMAAEQSLTGVLYEGVSRLSNAVPLSEEVKLTWFFQTEQIVEANKKMNAATVKVAKRLRKEGFDCCILKGQGNALMYPEPLQQNAPPFWARFPAKRQRRNRTSEVSPPTAHCTAPAVLLATLPINRQSMTSFVTVSEWEM